MYYSTYYTYEQPDYTFEWAITTHVWCDLSPAGKNLEYKSVVNLAAVWRGLWSEGGGWEEPGICVWGVPECCLMQVEQSVASQMCLTCLTASVPDTSDTCQNADVFKSDPCLCSLSLASLHLLVASKQKHRYRWLLDINTFLWFIYWNISFMVIGTIPPPP